MRNDMFKVIVERPRLLHSDKYGNIRNSKITDLYGDDLPHQQSMRKIHSHTRGWDRKQLNENLKPLVRFLEKSIGRKWDDVYSEICANLKGNSTVKQHVKDHVHQYVGLDLRFHRYDPDLHRASPFYYVDYYVDEDGILQNGEKLNPRKKYLSYAESQANELRKKYRYKDGKEIWKIDGIWYEPVWGIVPGPQKIPHWDRENKKTYWTVVQPSKTDYFTHQPISEEGAYYRSDKKQANKKILRFFGVKNDIKI